MVSKRRKLVLLTAAFVLCIAPIASVLASPASNALVAEGRALIFQGEATTYADLVAARDKFAAALASDPTDKAASLFHAVARIAASLIETSPAGLNTVADLATLFGLDVSPNRALGDAPISEPPELYDQYDPPATVPDGETVRAFVGGPLLTEIEGALANLNTVGSGYNLTLNPQETGDQPVEIDDGDILVLQSSLHLLKAIILIVTAYDLDVDLRELMVLGNAGVLNIRKILDLNPDLLKLRPAEGATQLAAARTSLTAGIDAARAAYDFISTETDAQDDDLLYFDSYRARQEALETLVELEEINSALVENRAAAFSKTSEWWTLTNGSGDQLKVFFHYISTPPADNFEDLIVPDGSFYAPGGCGFFDRDGLACDGSVESVLRNGNQVTWNLTTGGFWPTTAQFIGTISAETISGTYTWTSAEGFQSGPFQFSGMRDDLETKTDRIDPNAVFGSAGHAPLDIRAVLPKFGIYDDPVAGTFPANAGGQILNGMWPDATTNEQLAKEWELRHETRLDGTGSSFFSIPAVADGGITLDGNPADWAALPETLVFTDFVGDQADGTDFDGGDIDRVYTAKDNTYLYIGIQLADGDPLAQPGMVYVWEAMNDYENSYQAGNLICYAYYADGQWVPGIGTRNADPWMEPTMLWTGTSVDVAEGTGFIEWRVPLSDVGNQLSGRWLRVYSHQTDGGEISDDNLTQIRLDTATLSGTISCADCPAGGKFFIAALPCEAPAYRCGDQFGETFVEAAGSYTLTGIPIGTTVYLHVLHDADNNGILSFGDTLGVSGPVTMNSGANALNVAADTPVDDNFVRTKPGVYRVFGATANPLGQPFYGPWDPNEIDWSNADLTFLGEFTDTATLPTDQFYKYILVLWHGDRIFHFDAIQDLTAGTAFRRDESGNPTWDGWITAGLSNLGGDQWQEPTLFMGPPDGQAAVNGDWPGFVLLEMPDDSLNDATARQLQVTVLPPFTFDATLMNLHDANGTQVLLISDIYKDDGNLPEDIEQWAVTGPGVNISYTGAQIAAGVDGIFFDPAWNEIALWIPGSPQVGAYTFRLTIDGQTRTQTDIHHINRNLPLPDTNGFAVQPDAMLTSKTPMFAWAPITEPAAAGIDGAPIAYRLQIRDRSTGELMISTPRTYGMNHYTVPAGKLTAGRDYEYRVRATDSSNWLDVQNRSHSAWVPFSMAADLNHASAPQFKPHWNALTWTTPNGTLLAGSVRIFDPDGIAADGSSHQVSVALPDGSSGHLDFDQSIDNQTAYYWGSGPLPPQPAGTYTFTVTDPEGHTATTSDVLTFNPLAPVDAARLRPSLLSPVQEYIHAVFDDVKVNGANYDDFAGGPLAPSRWTGWSGSGVMISDQALHLTTSPGVGRRNVSVQFADPQAADAIEARVTVAEASSDDSFQARISGNWFNLNGLDVWAGISVTPDRVTYSMSTNLTDETLHWQEIANGPLKTLTVGETVSVGIAWDGQRLTFKADEETYTYAPTGTILPARYPDKMLQARINLFTSVTPTFRWNPIESAQRYRVRIYNHDNTRTIHRGYVNDGQATTYTVPHGVLRPGAYYRYRVEAWDSTDVDVDNVSKVPASNGDNFIFYTGIPGDMNNDGFVDLSDAIRALQVLSANGAVRTALAGDADADRRIGATEAMHAMQAVAGWR